MPHVDPDVLALLALGEPVASEAEEQHLAECPDCAAVVDDLHATVEVGRAARSTGPLLAPPARVWEGIAAELGLAPGIGPAAEPRSGPPPAASVPGQAAASSGASASVHALAPEQAPSSGRAPTPDQTPAPDQSAAAPEHPLRPPVPLEHRRDRRRLAISGFMIAAAAVAVVALGAAALQFAARPPQGTVVAEATLDAFPDWSGASGAAVLEELPDGTRQVEVILDADVSGGALQEVWLIRGDGSDLVSLGVLRGSEGAFAVPSGVDVEDFNLVDVSAEPQDGDPAHSGDSIVRGPLT